MFLRLLLFIFICGKCWMFDNAVSAQKASTDSTVEELLREVKAMKIALNQMILRDSQQEKQLSDMRETINLLKTDNTNLKRSNSELKRDNTQLKKDNTELKNAYTDFNHRMRRLELNKEEVKETFALRKVSQTIKLPRDQNKRQDGKNQKSNSTAHRFRDSVHLNVGQTIIFNKVMSNIGGLYNANTGVFTADTAGIYVFYVNILCLINRVTWTELVRDGISLTLQVCDGRGQVYDNGSSMAVIDLPVGASVWVRVRRVDRNDQEELGQETSFSGFLLKCT